MNFIIFKPKGKTALSKENIENNRTFDLRLAGYEKKAYGA